MYVTPNPLNLFVQATHKYWPADVPHLGFHECAEMSVQYLDTNGLGTAFSNKSFDGHQVGR